MAKNSPAKRRHKRLRFSPWLKKGACGRGNATYSSILLGKFHEQRSLMGYSPWGLKGSDMTEYAYITKKNR